MPQFLTVGMRKVFLYPILSLCGSRCKLLFLPFFLSFGTIRSAYYLTLTFNLASRTIFQPWLCTYVFLVIQMHLQVLPDAKVLVPNPDCRQTANGSDQPNLMKTDFNSYCISSRLVA